MTLYDALILAVFLVFAADIIGPRLYQWASWWFENFGPEEEEEDEEPPPV